MALDMIDYLMDIVQDRQRQGLYVDPHAIAMLDDWIDDYFYSNDNIINPIHVR